eukprot:COSAG02_NODE_170_length_31534_cov_33.568498_28_plen_37_part_00
MFVIPSNSVCQTVGIGDQEFLMSNHGDLGKSGLVKW